MLSPSRRAIHPFLAWLLILLPAACSSLRPTAEHALHPNPVLIKVRDQDFVWEHIACVMGDYFRIEREDRVKRLGDVLTEGTLETSYEVGATLLEPWRSDSAGTYNQVESTLQTIRRRAVVKVVPAAGGYLVEVQVFKELEDLARPQNGAAADAMFRFDGGLAPLREPVGPNPPTLGWIPLGRDVALEQRIIARFLSITGP